MCFISSESNELVNYFLQMRFQLKYDLVLFFPLILEVKSVKMIVVIEKNMQRNDTTSSQDGGVDGYTLPPHTIKRSTTTNLKTKNNQI